MRIQKDYPDPIRGVSTSPEQAREAGFMNSQLNMKSDRKEMLIRRPPATTIIEQSNMPALPQMVGDMVGSYSWDKDGVNWDIFAMRSNGNTTIYAAADGVLVPVQYNQQSAAYVNSANGDRNSVRFKEIDGDIYLWSTNKITAMSDTTGDWVNHKKRALVRFLISATYKEVVEVRVNNNTFTWTAPAVDATDADANRTAKAMAIVFRDLINANSNYNAIVQGTTLAVKSSSGADVTINSQGASDELMTVVNWRSDTAAGLPKMALPGFRIKIEPDPANTARGSYWLRAVSIDGTPDNTSSFVNADIRACTWIETRDPAALPHIVNKSTMPHKVTTTYTLPLYTIDIDPIEWDERPSGDPESSPAPSFIGEPVADLEYLQDRLVIVTSKSVALSRTANKEMYFRNSMAKTLVTDSIDMKSTSSEAGDMEWATQHNGDVLIFSDRAQFKIFGGKEPVTPETSALTMVSRYNVDPGFAPASVGNQVMFLAKFGSSRQLLSYSAGKETGQDTAVPLADEYLEILASGISSFKVSEELDMAVISTYNDGVHVMEFDYDGQDFTRVAWHKWDIANYGDTTDVNVQHVNFREDKLRMWQKATNGRYYPLQMDFGTETLPKLDRKITLDTIDFGSQQYGWELSISDEIEGFDKATFVYWTGEQFKPVFVEIQSTNVGNRWVIQDKYYAGEEISMGAEFSSSFQPTQAMIYDEDGNPDTVDRVRVSRFFLDVVETDEISMSIASQFSNYDTQVKNPRVLGQFALGDEPPMSKRVSFSFASDPRYARPTFFTSGLGDLRVTKISWVGGYYRSARSI